MVGLYPLSDIIKHCFEKCGFPTDDYVAMAQDSDEEFEMLYNEISKNCSIGEYAEVDKCIEEVVNVETASSDLKDENEDESQERSSSSKITPKETLSLLNKLHLFATYNENNDLQHRIDDIITTSIRTKKKALITDFFH